MPRSENSKLMKVAYISEDYAHEISGHLDFSVKSYELNGGQQKSVPAETANNKAKYFCVFAYWTEINTKNINTRYYLFEKKLDTKTIQQEK